MLLYSSCRLALRAWSGPHGDQCRGPAPGISLTLSETMLSKLHTTVLRLIYRRRWSRLSLPEVAREFGTPGQLDVYMRICFEYVSDADLHGIEEFWQAPETTHTLRRGDCEDYALFARHVLNACGYETHVFAAFTPDDGHAVCVFSEAGHYHTLCNLGIQRLRIRQPRRGSRRWQRLARRIADRIYPAGWECCSFVELGAETGDDGRHPRELTPRYDWIYPPRAGTRSRLGQKPFG